TVLGGEVGHRVRALDAIRRAAVISKSAELRREVLAAMALPDLRFRQELSFGRDATHVQLDPTFQKAAVGRGNGPVEIRAVPGNQVLASLPASTNLPSYLREWSADGRLLAVKRDYPEGARYADWEVWDMMETKRIFLLRDVGNNAFAFHPRRRQIVARTRTEGVALWDLENGTQLTRFKAVG